MHTIIVVTIPQLLFERPGQNVIEGVAHYYAVLVLLEHAHLGDGDGRGRGDDGCYGGSDGD